jgi:hypothetical protein
MSDGYTKLFSSIVHSTVWRESNHVRLTWVTLLALSDRDGRVEASIPGLADAARVTISECEDALSRLAEPDPYSRSREHQGRRISAVDGGWELLNHAKYREKSSYEERREKAKERKRKQRDRERDKRDMSHAVPPGHASHDIAVSEAKADQPPVSPPLDSRDESPSEAKPNRRKPKKPIPKDWTPNAAHASKAATLGLNLDAEARKFRNNAEGKDVRWVDWDKAFHNWIENGATYAPRGSGAAAGSTGATPADRELAARDAVLLAEIRSGAWGERARSRSLDANRPIDLRKFREAITAGQVRRIATKEPRSGPRASSRPPPAGDAPTGSLAQLANHALRGMP